MRRQPTNMKEIEVKILEIDKGAILARLEQLGAEKHFEGEMQSLFFDDEARNIAHRGEVLRLRKEGDEIVMAFKSPVSGGEAKIMEELEITVSDLEIARKLLEKIGFAVHKATRKIRTEYLLAGAKVVIDEYRDQLANIPPFVEIEAPDLKIIYKVVALLGFTPDQCTDWNTYDLVRHYAPEINPE
jgi:adenylate cyclase class 2